MFWDKHQRVESSGDLEIRLAVEDRPEWKRIYVADLPRGCRLKVEMRSTKLSRYDMSEITQRGGQWVLFDVKRPADKILDRELLPDVERLCAQILDLDHQFLRNLPNEFFDDQGQRWVRG